MHGPRKGAMAQGIPVIICSGWPEDGDARPELHGVTWLEKPVDAFDRSALIRSGTSTTKSRGETPSSSNSTRRTTLRCSPAPVREHHERCGVLAATAERKGSFKGVTSEAAISDPVVACGRRSSLRAAGGTAMRPGSSLQPTDRGAR